MIIFVLVAGIYIMALPGQKRGACGHLMNTDVTTPNISCWLIAKSYLCQHRITVEFTKLSKISSFLF